MPGPRPTPTAIKKLRGSRIRGRRGEPTPTPGAPTRPRDLSPAERACWNKLVGELRAVPGLLTRCDRSVLERTARVEAQIGECRAERRLHGASVARRDDKGQIISVSQAPWVKTEIALGAQYRNLLCELGLSPASRARVAVAEALPASSDTDRFFGPQAVPMRKVGA